jgi:hypothetical protein
MNAEGFDMIFGRALVLDTLEPNMNGTMVKVYTFCPLLAWHCHIYEEFCLLGYNTA